MSSLTGRGSLTWTRKQLVDHPLEVLLCERHTVRFLQHVSYVICVSPHSRSL